MSVSLSKGGNVSLSKEEPNLSKILIGLGWDTRTTDGADFDLDASAFLLASGDKVRGDGDFIFRASEHHLSPSSQSPAKRLPHRPERRRDRRHPLRLDRVRSQFVANGMQ